MFTHLVGFALGLLSACESPVEDFNEENLAQATCLDETLPYTGPAEPNIRTGYGAEMIRNGPVLRSPSSWSSGDFLSVFREDKGFVSPSTLTGLLSNPHRPDGTALNANYVADGDFMGHAPVYTTGNWWPYIGDFQPQPPHPDHNADSGVYIVDGQRVCTTEPMLLEGMDGVYVHNATNMGILITAGSYPGNEQPGQVMTPVYPGNTEIVPVPPLGWFPDGSGNPRVPELYVSVADIDPLDVVGWHESCAFPQDSTQPQFAQDYGTPGFAYTIGSKYSEFSGGIFLVGGLHRNEGYDPYTSGDPGYGIAVYVDESGEVPNGGPTNNARLVAVTDMTKTGELTAHQDLWALDLLNPRVNDQGGLSAFPAIRLGETLYYELITHDRAQQLIGEQGGPTLSRDYEVPRCW